MTFRFAERLAISTAFAALALALWATLSAAPAAAQGVSRDESSLAGRLLVATPRSSDPSSPMGPITKHFLRGSALGAMESLSRACRSPAQWPASRAL